jgi:hypothetical protein
MQPLEPHKQAPAYFSADEAHELLEKRWSEVTAQGLQPTCQCSSKADEAADGGITPGDGSSSKASSAFLAALQDAVKVNSADGAWDD